MQPHIDARPDGTNSKLVCPCCGSLETQHLKVEIFKKIEIFREVEVLEKQEDFAKSLDVEIDKERFDRNTSRENDGVRIIFCCAECSRNFALEIVQHEGMSYINARKEW